MKPGLILFAHGSRDPRWAEPFESVRAALSRTEPGLAVRLAYLEFMAPTLDDAADALVEELGLDGELQVASFHPRYQFEGTEPDDITNYSNRSPYPTLHLLREASIDRAVEAFPEAESIFEANIETLKRLGIGGWLALGLRK